MRNCTECFELSRYRVITRNDYNYLVDRTKARHPSRAERRRLVRLRTAAYEAKEEWENHRATCSMAVAKQP